MFFFPPLTFHSTQLYNTALYMQISMSATQTHMAVDRTVTMFVVRISVSAIGAMRSAMMGDHVTVSLYQQDTCTRYTHCP